APWGCRSDRILLDQDRSLHRACTALSQLYCERCTSPSVQCLAPGRCRAAGGWCPHALRQSSARIVVFRRPWHGLETPCDVKTPSMLRGATLRANLLDEDFTYIGKWDLLGSLGVLFCPEFEFYHAAFEAALSHGDAKRQSDQVCILELYPGALVAVVDEGLIARLGQLFFYLRDGRFYFRAFSQLANVHRVRSDGYRPDETQVIRRLFNNRGHQTRDTNAVAAHDERLLRALIVYEGGVHLLTVMGPEDEDVARFYASVDINGGTAARAWVPRRHGA